MTLADVDDVLGCLLLGDRMLATKVLRQRAPELSAHEAEGTTPWTSTVQ